MRIALKLEDGTEEIREVSQMAFLLETWRLEVKPHANPLRLDLRIASKKDEFCIFEIRAGGCNVMDISLDPHPRIPSSPEAAQP